MQKLYKVAFQRILTKIGAPQTQNLTVEAIRNLLKQKNVPIEDIDETIFHKLPRQELKNLVRNPCPVTKPQQTSSQVVTNAKAIRGALNIVEKKICFKCPFVASCDKAFIEPPTDFLIKDPLPNLLITMKNLSQLESTDKIKNRSWFSGVRVCDSLNSIFDDLLAGGEEFKIFKQERNTLRDESEAQKQNQDQSNNQVAKKAKKNKVPLRDIYAQIPTSDKTENQGQKEGEQAFEVSSKGPENIFKQKKSEEFIKIAQKYLNNDKVEDGQEERKYVKKQRKQPQNQQSDGQEQNQNRRPQRRQERGQYNQTRGRQNITRQQRPPYENRQKRSPREWQQKKQFGNQKYQSRRDDRSPSTQNYNDRNTERYERKGQQSDRGTDRYQKRGQQYDRSAQQSDRSSQQYDRKTQPYDRSSQQYDRKTQPYDRNNQQSKGQRYGNESQERDPKIRRFSKERPNTSRNYQEEQSEAPRRGKMDKFYSPVKDFKNDEEQILSSFNKRQTPRSSNLPRDAKYGGSQRNERSQGSREFSERDMKEFDRLQKVPKILKTQFASKQDVQQRVQQESSGEQVQGERKGRRVKRG